MPQLGSLEKALRFGEGRRLKRLRDQAGYIATLEPEFEQLTPDQLRQKTADFRQRFENGATLEELLFEAFAAVREARKRASDQRLFDVQMMGGIVLHEGDIAEMKTGEGKTYVASLALYLNALAGRGAHLVTVNDYLAKRDAEWNKPVYDQLGVTVSFVENMMPFAERKAAYDADITYGTNSEFGFDYLRDNMAVSLDGVVQRGHAYGIVDEVDSILVDEARTPLIISGEPEVAAETYYDFARVVKGLEGMPTKQVPSAERKGKEMEADFEYDEKHKTVSPGPGAIEKVERTLRIDNLYDPRNVQLVNHLIQALKAQSLYQRDIDYVIQDGEVKIVDEFTGRIMEGRRWSEGLHQAVEAKEGVRIQEEHVTLATITLQNYFRLYEKLAGMTGTAKTEEKEFVEIYGLHVVEIPTNVPVVREDKNDMIFRTKDGKFDAVVRDIKERAEQGQPVLVGTIAVETSQHLHELLQRAGVTHNVLNAKEHEREAEIIKDAGAPGAVTVATNMAGRGVDIKLGEGVVEAGGLYVLATERHEARRIDNQLRGRSGRQGDPGETRFYLSGEDDLVRLFAGDRIKNIMSRFKVPDDQPMEAAILSRQIENAQKKVEEQNFVMRKNVLKYDDVMNMQRTVIYEQRRAVLEGVNLSEQMKEWIEEVVDRNVRLYTEAEFAEEWDLDELCSQMQALYGSDITPEELREDEVEMTPESLIEEFAEDAWESYKEREESFGKDPETGQPIMRELERFIVLNIVDVRWREHLESMDYLREGVHLRAMAQKDPLVEYTAEGHKMFEELNASIREEVVLHLFHAEIAPAEAAELQAAQQAQALDGGALSYEHQSFAGAEAMAAAGAGGNGASMTGVGGESAGATLAGTVGGGATSVATTTRQRVTSDRDKVGRNDPCWCGSGKKYKKCHGAQASPEA
jgi:preprotein translocase subunit SecA